MTIKIKTDLQGFENFDKLLSQLPMRVEKRVLQSAVTSAVREARKEIKKSIPVGDEKQSAASQRYGRAKTNLRVKRLRRTKRNEKMARVDTGDAFWMLFYELGSRFQPARPFFANAFERARSAMIKKLRERLSLGIKKEFDKLNK